MAIKSINKIEGRGTREGASSLVLNIYNEGKSIFQEILCEQFKQVLALMMNNILMTRTITFKYECTVIYVS